MQLMTFKTLWGHPDTDRIDSLVTACDRALSAGFDGIEGQIPVDSALGERFAEALAARGLAYIAEVCTAGSYVPDRTASLTDHLADLDGQLRRLGPLKPLLVNCIGGCDRWDIATSVEFFRGALDLAGRHGVAIAFETHRGRSLYSPWVAEKVLERLALPLTCDFSHWCVVCEGLGESEDELLREVARCAVHIHGRVGYDQGPQVPDPQASRYAADLERHLRWWRWIWEARNLQGHSHSTLTPEFGPDGYQAIDPVSDRPVGDLDELNRWLAQRCRAEFTGMGDDGREKRPVHLPSPAKTSPKDLRTFP